MAVRTFTIMSAAVVSAVVAGVTPGEASGSFSGSCVRSSGGVSCAARWGSGGPGFPSTINVPGPQGERAAAEAAERERKWLARCRPVVEQDRYGVGRYRYSAAGCEFGKSTD